MCVVFYCCGAHRDLHGVARRQRQMCIGDSSGRESDWTLWLAESREFLVPSVYDDSPFSAIASADSSGAGRLPNQTLSDDYVNEMISIASDRLGLTGLRLAIWFQNELPPATAP